MHMHIQEAGYQPRALYVNVLRLRLHWRWRDGDDDVFLDINARPRDYLVASYDMRIGDAFHAIRAKASSQMLSYTGPQDPAQRLARLERLRSPTPTAEDTSIPELGRLLTL